MSRPPASPASSAALPRLAVVVPVYDAAAVLARTLPAMRAQDLPADWVFVDDGSRDGSAERVEALLAQYPPAMPGSTAHVVRHGRNRGRSAARNTGLSQVDAPVVVFLDADMAPGPGFLRAHARMHLRPEVVGAVSPENWGDLDASDPYHRYLARYPRGARTAGERRPLDARYFIIGYTSLRTEAVRAAGGFDESIPYGEDLDLAIRLVERHPDGLWLAAAADVVQYGAPRLDEALAKWRRFGRESVPRLLARSPALAPAFGAAVAGGSASRTLLGRLLLRDGLARPLRRRIGAFPAAVEVHVVRYLVGCALAEGVREAGAASLRSRLAGAAA